MREFAREFYLSKEWQKAREYIFIRDGGKLTAIYPINVQRVDLVENMGGIYARLGFATGNAYTVPYEHFVHLRRH